MSVAVFQSKVPSKMQLAYLKLDLITLQLESSVDEGRDGV